MTPKVKTWLVRAVDSWGREHGRWNVHAPTKLLAGLNFRQEYGHPGPGLSLKISVARPRTFRVRS